MSSGLVTISLEVAAVPLTPQQNALVELHSSTTISGGISRGRQYLEENQKISSNFKTVSVATIIACTATGALVGGGIGTFVNPGTGTGGGALAGAAIGGLIGAVAGPIAISIEISNSSAYIRWKTRALQKKVYPLFQEILKKESFIGLVCPITQELPLIPVKAPCNHVFERYAIDEWLRTKPANAAPCPSRCHTQFTFNDLYYCQERVNEITTAARAQLNEIIARQEREAKGEEEIKSRDDEKSIAQGLRSIMKNGKKTSAEVFKQIVSSELNVAIKSKLKKDEVAKIMGDLYSTFMMAHI